MATKGNNLTRNRPSRVVATRGEATKPSEASAERRRVAEKVRLADVVDINTSSPPNYEGVKRYISTGAIVDGAIVESQVEMFGFSERPSRADLYPKEGDVLFAKMQATRKTFVVDRMNSGSLYSTGFYALTPHKDEIDTLYLSHYLDSEQFLSAKDKECNGATQKALSGVGFKKILVPLPPLPAQRRIAAELDKICELKKNAETLLEKLDLLVKSRFVEMFGTLAEHRFEECTLESICEFIKDGTHQTPTYTTDTVNGYKFLSSKDVVGGVIDWSRIKYIPRELHEELYARLSPRKNDILLAKNGTTGVAALVETDEVFDIYVSLALLRFKADVEMKYILWAINAPETKRQFNHSLKGVGVPNLHLGEIKKTIIPNPPLALQREFAAFVAKVDKLRLNVRETVAKMDVLYRSKLQEYFG